MIITSSRIPQQPRVHHVKQIPQQPRVRSPSIKQRLLLQDLRDQARNQFHQAGSLELLLVVRGGPRVPFNVHARPNCQQELSVSITISMHYPDSSLSRRRFETGVFHACLNRSLFSAFLVTR